MYQEFDLHYGENKVGVVKLSKKGMFYLVTCRFCTQANHVFRLHCTDGVKVTELGPCVRYGSLFGIERCLPMKLIGTGKLRFYITADTGQVTFLTVSELEPFSRLDALLSGRFFARSGITGIYLCI